MNINQCSDEYKAYLKSPKWRKIQEIILNRDRKCKMCGSTEHLHVHHIRGVHRFNEENHLEDLCLLCESCHSRIHLYFKICDSLREYYENMRKANL